MEQGYAEFVMGDPSFYDAMHSEQIARMPFLITERLLPDCWRCVFLAPHWVARRADSGNLSATRVEGGLR